VNTTVNAAGYAQTVRISIDTLVLQALKVGFVQFTYRADIGRAVSFVDVATDFADPFGAGNRGFSRGLGGRLFFHQFKLAAVDLAYRAYGWRRISLMDVAADLTSPFHTSIT